MAPFLASSGQGVRPVLCDLRHCWRVFSWEALITHAQRPLAHSTSISHTRHAPTHASLLSTPATILYCRCAYAQVVPTGVKNEVLQRLCDSSTSFETVSDLCEMAAHRDPRLQAIASCGSLRIAACYPRAVKGLFQQAGSPLPPDTEILNMRSQTAQEITESLLCATLDTALTS